MVLSEEAKIGLGRVHYGYTMKDIYEIIYIKAGGVAF